MNFFRFSLVLLFVLVNALWASTLSVRLTTERHRTEWNWVEYRLKLKNLSNKPLKNPVVRYFAENPRIQYCEAHPNDTGCAGMEYGAYDVDSTLRAVVDYFSVVNSVKPKYYYDSKHTVITFKFQGSIPAGASSKVHLRIMKKNYPAWDCSRDYSFQKNAVVQEENYKMAVYDADGNILWGNDPVLLKHDTAHVYWHDRSSISVISPYEAKDSSKTLSGRFWLLKDKALTSSEERKLDSLGVVRLEATRFQNKGLYLFKAATPVQKKQLDSTVYGFYNGFAVDDTTRFVTNVVPDDFNEETRTCDENDSCTTVVTSLLAINMVIECWPDLQMQSCKDVVLNCGGDSAYIDRRVILAKVRRDSIQCLEKHKDVRLVYVRRKGLPLNDNGRKSINLTELQDDSRWRAALQATQVTSDWLEGVDYTGEGITVGVYDTGIDFSHPAFNEVDASGEESPRVADGFKVEMSVGNEDEEKRITKDHGTHVAGIVGGNGRKSETYDNAASYQYRGVAPKVKFYSGPEDFYNQRGDVVNHSHYAEHEKRIERDKDGVIDEIYYAYYGVEYRNLDWNIFRDWNDVSDFGDNRSKAVVLAVGNNGKDQDFSDLLGYHSILNDSKNAIVVGSFDPEFNVLSNFSSLGPTWDGRIKPDIMAPGRGVVSCVPYGLMGAYYKPNKGTSMSAPFVSGVAALMYQKFQKQTGVSLDVYSMRNSTVKALLIHSAIDMVGCDNVNVDIKFQKNQPRTCTPYTAGPDFATGWGRIDAKGAMDLMDGYNVQSKKFKKFREFYLSERGSNEESPEYAGERRWAVFVTSPQKRIRATLVWDDAPGKDFDMESYMTRKLVNDLDLYLVSPTGRTYYPWRLDSLSTQKVDANGFVWYNNELAGRGREKITFDEASKPAYRDCKGNQSTNVVDDDCFDEVNNVEVVDVDNPELGVWYVVAKGRDVKVGNSSDGKAQLASIVSDLELVDMLYDDTKHPYEPNAKMGELMDLGDGYLEHLVTFGPETSLGAGDHIYLYDGWNRLIGDFTGNSLANQQVSVSTRYLKIILDSDDDDSQGWGYSITNVEHVPYGVLQVLFPPYKKGE